MNETPSTPDFVCATEEAFGLAMPWPVPAFGVPDKHVPEAVRETIVQARPGLTGIGSIVFRDEAELTHCTDDAVHRYDNLIAPYKGAIEQWYVEHQGLCTYFLLIFLHRLGDRLRVSGGL